jgi:peptide/nickel transport system permease protein
MLKLILRRFILMILTMVIVSVAVFAITQASPGNIARNILGAYVTPEQEASFIAQEGLDQPLWLRYWYWLAGSDRRAEAISGLDLIRVRTEQGFVEWWALLEDGRLARWKLEGDDLVVFNRKADGTTIKQKDNRRWRTSDTGAVFFWGVDTDNNLVRWEKGVGRKVWIFIEGIGWKESTGGAVEYLPLVKGILRGDAGESLLTGRPVSQALSIRLRNSIFLTCLTFVITMPLALALGVLAGLREGSFWDRSLSIGGMIFAITPLFVTGVFSILIFSFWLGWVPGATVYGNRPPWARLDMMVLPVVTLALSELGYVLRITRASMVEVMRSPYIRTAYLKGLTYRRIIWHHALRNALIAPITVIMLHVNWLLSGVVIVEVVFGYPGLGKYLYESALGKDIHALEAGAMVMVAVAVGTQLIADIIYTLINPRIRYK